MYFFMFKTFLRTISDRLTKLINQNRLDLYLILQAENLESSTN